MSTLSRTPTELLLAWNRGDRRALDRLVPMVEHELRRLARRCMAHERPEHTLQATALLNEAYLRLLTGKQVHWQGRAHFFAVAARTMRRILVDYARAHDNAKRGGRVRKVSLDESLVVSPEPEQDLVGLEEALGRLEVVHPRKGRVVELRFFGGLSLEETARVLEISVDTVKRDWRFAKAWLLGEMERLGRQQR
jgi:RNA polymerase sigma factor (TIGR02999 family)